MLTLPLSALFEPRSTRYFFSTAMQRLKYLPFCLLLLAACAPSSETPAPPPEVAAVQLPEPPPPPFGLDFSQFEHALHTISNGEFFGGILGSHAIPQATIHAAVVAAEGVFDLRQLRTGRILHMLFSKDSGDLAAMVYEKSPRDYVRFDFREEVVVSEHDHPIEMREGTTFGSIQNSLYVALEETGASPELSMTMANIYAWTVDFYRVQKGDGFKVIYQEEWAMDKRVGSGDIQACMFFHRGRWIEAFRWEKEGKVDYYDWEGESLRKAFLKAPLKYSRISSHFTKKRFHPVLKRYKAHLGTDYAAPQGTPILAVGDGEVIKSEYKGGNGNYVKIRHNGTYTTQYLHMSKRAAKVGDKVQQGDVIGYVGATGLATGPHVCFRFWKNGQQVDHLQEDFPTADPLAPEQLEAFREAHRATREQLQEMEVPTTEPVNF